jgi:hypothetical protein
MGMAVGIGEIILLILGLMVVVFVARNLFSPTVSRTERGAVIVRQEELRSLWDVAEATRELLATLEDPAMTPDRYNQAVTRTQAALQQADSMVQKK